MNSKCLSENSNRRFHICQNYLLKKVSSFCTTVNGAVNTSWVSVMTDTVQCNLRLRRFDEKSAGSRGN